MTSSSRRRPNAGRTALVLVLALALALGSWAWAAAPTEAITGGREADRQYGQVQFYVASKEAPTGSYVCAGTLIDPEWVLTAKHCIDDPGATKDNSFVLTGDRRLGYGAAHAIGEIHREDNTDSALLKLVDASSAEVVGYSANELDLNSTVDIAGWGSEGSDPPSPTLQVATMLNIDTQWIHAEVGDRLLFEDIGQGIPQEGDSGAGVHPLEKGVIYGVHSGGSYFDNGDYEGASAVPTNDIAGWIEQKSGVAPSDPPAEEDGGDPVDEDSPDGGTGGCEDSSPTLEAEGTSAEGTGYTGRYGSAWSNPDVENADENVKDLVSWLAEANPECNVMVIQQETYDGPQGIAGVKEQHLAVFGTNTFDVWVFDSGAFTNTGDMGYDNWGWSGTWTRSEDQRTVTFEPVG